MYPCTCIPFFLPPLWTREEEGGRGRECGAKTFTTWLQRQNAKTRGFAKKFFLQKRCANVPAYLIASLRRGACLQSAPEAPADLAHFCRVLCRPCLRHPLPKHRDGWHHLGAHYARHIVPYPIVQWRQVRRGGRPLSRATSDTLMPESNRADSHPHGPLGAHFGAEFRHRNWPSSSQVSQRKIGELVCLFFVATCCQTVANKGEIWRCGIL